MEEILRGTSHPKKGRPTRAVVVSGKVWKAIRAAPDQSKAQLLKTFDQWCEGYALPDGKHKRNEGRYHHGEESILRQAFAASSIRVYGWIETVEGVETFILVDVDVNKKQQKADQDLLAEVGRKAFRLKGDLAKPKKEEPEK